MFFIVIVSIVCLFAVIAILFVFEVRDTQGMTGAFREDYRFERKPNCHAGWRAD
jgi:hypothetical protein